MPSGNFTFMSSQAYQNADSAPAGDGVERPKKKAGRKPKRSRELRNRTSESDAEIRQRIGQTLRAARESAGLSQRQVAAKLGVTNTAVMLWETGENLPTTSNRADLAQVLGLSIVQLLPEVEMRRRDKRLAGDVEKLLVARFRRMRLPQREVVLALVAMLTDDEEVAPPK